MATAVTFNQTSASTGIANAQTSLITVAAGTTYNFAYKGSATSTGRGAQIWASIDAGLTSSSLIPLVVKWDDRAAVQGYVNPQWICSVTGPIDIVLDKSNDMDATYYQFS
jgi:hypothetical protein